MKFFLIFLYFFSYSLFGQVSLHLNQSTPENEWEEIKSSDFKVVFPKKLKEDAQKAYTFLEYFAPKVSSTYNVKPSPIYLVLRPDMATPNGFVTLGPRRTEWYDHQSITPMVGSLHWLQSLAVHEYRHIAQYDFLSQGNTKVGYYLFGEFGLNLLLHLIAPSWFFEGDAVYAETIFTDAGRGRSPRFSARLKALVLSDQIPSYDELLAGHYLKTLPSYYTYGYFLITRARNIYGESVWKSIGEYAYERPWNFYTFYNGFKSVTGVEFKEFYNESIQELKEKWSDKAFETQEGTGLYVQNLYPYKLNNHLFYLEKIDGHYWKLKKDDHVISELNISPKSSKPDYNKDGFLFSQTTPHFRYLFKEEQNIFYYDFKTKKLTQITNGRKLYHPQFSPSGNSFLAIEKTNENDFQISLFSMAGDHLHSVLLKGNPIAEAVFKDESTVIASVLDDNGLKTIMKINLIDKSITPLSIATRNNIYNLFLEKEDLFFEADYQGAVNIFKYSLATKKYSRCTNEVIMAQTPYLKEGKLFYSSTQSNGDFLKSSPLSCLPVEEQELFGANNYISQTNPSDHYIKDLTYKPIEIPHHSKNLKTQKHSSLSGLDKPHSWSFFGGRGLMIQGDFQNNLGTSQLNLYTGVSAEESTPFIGGEYLYSGYYPILYLSTDYLDRNLQSNKGESVKWSELKSSLGFFTPYLYSKNLITSQLLVGAEVGHINITKNAYRSDYYLNDESLDFYRISSQFSINKNLRKREIIPKWGISNELTYTHINQDDTSTANYNFRSESSLYFPGFKDEHGIQLSHTIEQRPNKLNYYKLQENYTSNIHYTFSRGYDFEVVPRFQKYSFEYIMNLNFISWNFYDWIFINRVFLKSFVDHTHIEKGNYEEDIDFLYLNSQGAELYFETNTLRKLPLTYGLRYSHLQETDDDKVEVFLTTTFY